MEGPFQARKTKATLILRGEKNRKNEADLVAERRHPSMEPIAEKKATQTLLGRLTFDTRGRFCPWKKNCWRRGEERIREVKEDRNSGPARRKGDC